MAKIALDIIDNPTGCINAGADGKPVFCPWLRTQHFGQRWFCLIFRQTADLQDDAGAASGMGRLQRWPECLAAQIPE